jgi:hypothetical protein
MASIIEFPALRCRDRWFPSLSHSWSNSKQITLQSLHASVCRYGLGLGVSRPL